MSIPVPVGLRITNYCSGVLCGVSSVADLGRYTFMEKETGDY